MIEDRFQNLDCHEKIHQEKGHRKYEMCKQQPIIESDNFEESSGYEPRSNPYEQAIYHRTN